MKNEVMVKVNKVAKTGQIIAKIGKVIIVIVFIACIFAAAAFAVIPKDIVTMEMSYQAVINLALKEGAFVKSILSTDTLNNETLVINGIGYEVVDFEKNGNELKFFADAETYQLKLSNMLWVIIPAILYIAATYIVLYFVEKLCKALRYCKTPFTDEIVNALKKLAVSIIPMALLSSITQSVTAFIMTGNVNIISSIDLITVMLVVLFFLLAAIFKYGTMLQTESDETL